MLRAVVIVMSGLSILGVVGMGWDTCRAQEINYDEAKMPEFTLPDPLTTIDGRKVQTPEQWEARREEILGLFREHMFGQRPQAVATATYDRQPLNAPNLCCDGTMEQVKIRLSCEGRQLELSLLLILPGSDKPVPVFLAPNFHGNHTVTNHPDVDLPNGWVPNWEGSDDHKPRESQRGKSVRRWPVGTILKAGFGVATVYAGDIDADYDDQFAGDAHALLDGAQRDTDWATISAWAWGLSRVTDYLVTDSRIDAGRIAVLGHSRLGKTALWAGATDPRFALIVSNNSGCGGAALSRRRIGESVWRINESFPHWFNQKFKNYNDNEDACPVDQHMLIAALAPRPVYIASATEDRWADPKGEFLSAKYASPVYRLLGKEGLALESFPPPEQPCHSRIGYHLRNGKHDITAYDWEQYLKFATQHLETE